MTDDLTTLRRLPAAILAVAAAMAMTAAAAHADIRISGSEALVKIEAQDASLSDVMAQLGSMYGVTFRSVAPQDRSISGRYVGTLRKVIGRLLEKDNYVARLIDGRLAIVVYGSSAVPLNSVQSPARAAPPSAVAITPASAQRMLANPKGAADGGYMR
jgi:hypothetical protein